MQTPSPAVNSVRRINSVKINLSQVGKYQRCFAAASCDERPGVCSGNLRDSSWHNQRA